MKIRSLGTQTVNGAPVINNQEFNGFISANDGESIIAAGNLTQSESRTLHGYSLLTSVPGLANRNTQPLLAARCAPAYASRSGNQATG